jgi:hypothetical protein
MPLTIEQLPDEPIVIITLYDPIRPRLTPEEAEQFSTVLQQVGKKYCRITDFSHVNLSFSDMVLGLSADQSFTDPNVLNLAVGTQAIVKLAAESAGQTQYGGHPVEIYASLDEAVAVARQRMKNF